MSNDEATPGAAPGTVPSKDGEKWLCPITQACTTSKIHRRCTGRAMPGRSGYTCNGNDCYDCCDTCQLCCAEPPMELDYDLPEGEG